MKIARVESSCVLGLMVDAFAALHSDRVKDFDGECRVQQLRS
jgi:hypothetical protein